MQFKQLQLLIARVTDHLLFHRRRFLGAGLKPGDELTLERWQRIPLLTRRDLREHDLHRPWPTRGDTATQVADLFRQAFTVRNHLWHRRDLSGKLAVILANRGRQPLPPDGLFKPGWGPATDRIFRTGPSAVLASATEPQQQWEWLLKLQPDYLLTSPANFTLLLDRLRKEGSWLPNLREVRTIGGTVSPGLREECREIGG